MFNYKDWDRFCYYLNSSHLSVKLITDIEYGKKFDFCIKHDVETNLKKAYLIAKIEYKNSIRATYYIQANLLQDDKNVSYIQKIKALGHEIGYHYDVLDKNNGNIEKAIIEFKNNIYRFDSLGFVIRTICPHGNPIMKRNGWESNIDFIKSSIVRKSISSEGKSYIDAIYDIRDEKMLKIEYISDAGYRWSNGKYKNIDSIMKEKEKNIIVSTHPHRWTKYYLNEEFKLIKYLLMKRVTVMLFKNKFVKKIVTKYYYIARKI